MSDSLPFATVEDMTILWREMTEAEQRRAQALLVLVSDSLREEGRRVGRDVDLMAGNAVFELLIPKCDDHDWENRTVSFYGGRWKTFGIPLLWHNPPGSWNRKVMVERYG